MGTGDVSPPGGAPQGYFRLRPKVTKERLRGENPVWLRAYALAHRIFPLRTPVTGDAESVWQFYDRCEVIRIVSAFVFAQPLTLCRVFVRRTPTTRLARRSSLKSRRFYCGERAAAGGRNWSSQVLRAGRQKYGPKDLPPRSVVLASSISLLPPLCGRRRSFRCSSSPHTTRCAGLVRGPLCRRLCGGHSSIYHVQRR